MNVPTMVFTGPVLPGKEEEWRRFTQELLGFRLPEYEGLRRRLGIGNESVWLARTREGEMAIACLEAAEPELVVARLVASEEPFDVWFKQKLVEFHSCDLTWLPRRALELIFAYREAAEAEERIATRAVDPGGDGFGDAGAGGLPGGERRYLLPDPTGRRE